MNFSLPKSFFLIPSFKRLFSTTACVAIPAWSVPGCHRVSRPFILLNLTKTSCRLLFKACPICNLPVTLGGGITIENFLFDLFFFGLNKPFLIQKSEIFFSSLL